MHCVWCRMEAAPSVPFHERAPDLIKEEDVQSSQQDASEADELLPSRAWPRHDNAENHVPRQDRLKADISYEHSLEQSLPGELLVMEAPPVYRKHQSHLNLDRLARLYSAC